MNMTTDPSPSYDFSPAVARVLDIEDVTWGSPSPRTSIQRPNTEIIVRYRGRLKIDHDTAYRQLSTELRPLKVAPIFQSEDGRQAITLIEDPFSAIVSQVLKIQETSWGPPQSSKPTRFAWQGQEVRYRGSLLQDSITAYDKLASQVRPLNVTPLFRESKGAHEIILINGLFNAKPSNPWINLILFGLTVLSVIFAGTLYAYEGAANDLPGLLGDLIANLNQGIPFAASILAILLAHEFGHYLAARYHGSAVTLPYFLPFPFSPFGTLGAFIQLKEPPKNKRVLLDIGAAGPLAGLVVAIPVLLLGLSLSKIGPIPSDLPGNIGFTFEGNSILYLLAKFAVFREWLPMPASYGGMSPAIYWVRYFFTGLPTPLGGTDVLIHPIAWAGWAGLLVTALNLIPAGQLDGGHLIFTLLGARARALLPFIMGALLILGLVWSGWWLWVFLIFFLGRNHAEPLDGITSLDNRRKAIAILGLIIFLLVFTPVPLRAIAGAGAF
jgi:membrane-associated protease RseP (regulator of RpoE activity)